MEINKQQAIRKLFLLKLYEITDGDIWADPIMYEIGNSLYLDNYETDKIVDFLRLKGFIKINSKQRDISITVEGVEEAEKSFYLDNKIVSDAEIKEYLTEIDRKLDLISISAEIIYEDIMKQFKNGQSIQKKDIIMAAFGILSTYAVDPQKLLHILDIKNTQ